MLQSTSPYSESIRGQSSVQKKSRYFILVWSVLLISQLSVKPSGHTMLNPKRSQRA